MTDDDRDKLLGEAADTETEPSEPSAEQPDTPAAEAAMPAPVAADAPEEDAEDADDAENDEDDADEEDDGDEGDDRDDEDEDAGAAPTASGTVAKRRRPRLRRGSTSKDVEKAHRDEPSGKKPGVAPRRRRTARKPGEPLPVVRAQAKYVRSSARKARLVCDHIRGKSVEEARAILAHTPRAVARDWSKVLESAVANAEHNHELVGEDLYVKVVQADEGPTIKRHRPRAQGRATQIRKRTTHLTILLTPKE